MSRRVLDVGQCDPDHFAISRLLNENFDVQIQRAHAHDQAIQLADCGSFDLILINRILDSDGTAGMDVLRTLKSTESTSRIPAMLISNFEDAQNQAISMGAVPGFGKSALGDPATINTLSTYLAGQGQLSSRSPTETD